MVNNIFGINLFVKNTALQRNKVAGKEEYSANKLENRLNREDTLINTPESSNFSGLYNLDYLLLYKGTTKLNLFPNKAESIPTSGRSSCGKVYEKRVINGKLVLVEIWPNGAEYVVEVLEPSPGGNNPENNDNKNPFA